MADLVGDLRVPQSRGGVAWLGKAGQGVMPAAVAEPEPEVPIVGALEKANVLDHPATAAMVRN